MIQYVPRGTYKQAAAYIDDIDAAVVQAAGRHAGVSVDNIGVTTGKALDKAINGGLATAGLIEIAPVAFMRGRTLNNSFVLIDEAQNCTYGQLKMLLTRLGWHSTMVMTGDPDQTDLLPELSGLGSIAQRLDGLRRRRRRATCRQGRGAPSAGRPHAVGAVTTPNLSTHRKRQTIGSKREHLPLPAIIFGPSASQIPQ